MKDSELYGRARELAAAAEAANYPALIPRFARHAIREAAAIIEELAKREVTRCREQKTTENQ